MNIKECFSEYNIRSLAMVCEETGWTPESVAVWVRKQGGDIVAIPHKGNEWLFCQLPAKNTIPDIFEMYS